MHELDPPYFVGIDSALESFTASLLQCPNDPHLARRNAVSNKNETSWKGSLVR